jgi:periplasmic protein CpxP/Spy
MNANRRNLMAIPRTLLAAALAATLASGAFAQSGPQSGSTSQGHAHAHGQGPGKAQGRMDPAKREAHFNQRMAELKQKLQVTGAQEAAWNNFTSAMQPPAGMQRPDHEAMARMTTPERIDQMQGMHAQRSAEMLRRTEAVKTFYAALTPEQRKVFDEQPMAMMGQGGRHAGKGMHGGQGHGGQRGHGGHGGMHRS